MRTSPLKQLTAEDIARKQKKLGRIDKRIERKDDKFKDKDSGDGNQWASYSDLFMALSFIFLLLYVTSSLRNGTNEVQQNLENRKVMAEAEDLRQQIKVYNTLKENYLEKEASKDEQQVYAELMNKLELLQDDAKEEKNDLRRQAKENEKKEKWAHN